VELDPVDRVVAVAANVGRGAIGLRASRYVDRATRDLVCAGGERALRLPRDARVSAARRTEASRVPRTAVDAHEHSRDARGSAPGDSANREIAAARSVCPWEGVVISA
jgi:hypothetical protein